MSIDVLAGGGGDSEELVILVFEFQFDVFGRGVSFATKVKARACSALGLRFVTLDPTLLARQTACGASTIDHDCDSIDTRSRDFVATDGRS